MEVAKLKTDSYGTMMMKLRQQYDWLRYRDLLAEADDVLELMDKLTKDYAETRKPPLLVKQPTKPQSKGKK